MPPQFCIQCGHQLQAGARFCASCGALAGGVPSAGPTRAPALPAPGSKSVGGAVTLALILPFLGFYGIGHLYLERIGRGLAILFGDWAISTGAFVFLFVGFVFPGFLVLSGIFFLVSFVLFIWQILDASSLAKEWNRHVAETGQKPW